MWIISYGLHSLFGNCDAIHLVWIIEAELDSSYYSCLFHCKRHFRLQRNFSPPDHAIWFLNNQPSFRVCILRVCLHKWRYILQWESIFIGIQWWAPESSARVNQHDTNNKLLYTWFVSLIIHITFKIVISIELYCFKIIIY